MEVDHAVTLLDSRGGCEPALENMQATWAFNDMMMEDDDGGHCPTRLTWFEPTRWVVEGPELTDAHKRSWTSCTRNGPEDTVENHAVHHLFEFMRWTVPQRSRTHKLPENVKPY
jgi:hypothetical protein